MKSLRLVAAAVAVAASALTAPPADAIGAGAGTFVGTLTSPPPNGLADGCRNTTFDVRIQTVVAFATEKIHYEGPIIVTGAGKGYFCGFSGHMLANVGGMMVATLSASGTDVFGKRLVCSALGGFAVQAFWWTMSVYPLDEFERPCTLDGVPLQRFSIFLIGPLAAGAPGLDGSQTAVASGAAGVSVWCPC